MVYGPSVAVSAAPKLMSTPAAEVAVKAGDYSINYPDTEPNCK
jgi:hypothetical protein